MTKTIEREEKKFVDSIIRRNEPQLQEYDLYRLDFGFLRTPSGEPYRWEAFLKHKIKVGYQMENK
jgi:hypothetical protein